MPTVGPDSTPSDNAYFADTSIDQPVFQTVLKGITIIGSIVGTRLDLTEVFDLHHAGRTRVVDDTRRLDDVNAAIDDVVHARIPARLVFDLTG